MRFKISPQLPGAERTRVWHQNGSHPSTFPGAACHTKHFRRQCIACITWDTLCTHPLIKMYSCALLGAIQELGCDVRVEIQFWGSPVSFPASKSGHQFFSHILYRNVKVSFQNISCDHCPSMKNTWKYLFSILVVFQRTNFSFIKNTIPHSHPYILQKSKL